MRDKVPRVRAAAVEAMAANAEPIDLKEVPFEDLDPRVQIAVLHLSRKKNIAVPETVLDRLRKSSDPEVRKAAMP